MKALDIWGDPWNDLGHCPGCDCRRSPTDGSPKAPDPYCVNPICHCHEEFWETTSGEVPELVQRWRHGDR